MFNAYLYALKSSGRLAGRDENRGFTANFYKVDTLTNETSLDRSKTDPNIHFASKYTLKVV